MSKGICFKEPLFHATIEGRKTQTRRIVTSPSGFFQVASKNGIVTDIWQTDANGWAGDNLIPVKPRYKVGDTVYLKEPYIITGMTYEYKYLHKNKTDISCIDRNGGYKNKLFMPESAARYFIKITDVRCERLQDISEDDCMKEGIQREHTILPREYTSQDYMEIFERDYFTNSDGREYSSGIEAYAALIDSINGKGTWESNPFVWIYDYELSSRHEANLI